MSRSGTSPALIDHTLHSIRPPASPGDSTAEEALSAVEKAFAVPDIGDELIHGVDDDATWDPRAQRLNRPDGERKSPGLEGCGYSGRVRLAVAAAAAATLLEPPRRREVVGMKIAELLYSAALPSALRSPAVAVAALFKRGEVRDGSRAMPLAGASDGR